MLEFSGIFKLKNYRLELEMSQFNFFLKREQIFESLLQKLRGESALNSVSFMSGDNLYW